MLGHALPRRRVAIRRLVAGLLVATMAQWGCSADQRADRDSAAEDAAARPSTTEGASEPERLRARVADVPQATTLIDGQGPAALAAAASAAFFEHAPVAVVAPEDDVGAQARAASAAVALGAPLLLSGSSGGETVPPEAVAAGAGTAAPDGARAAADELLRLSPRAVLAVGSRAADWARGQRAEITVVAAPDDPEALRWFGGLDLAAPQVVAPGQLAAAAGALARHRPHLLAVEPGSAAAPVGTAEGEDPPAGAGEAEAAAPGATTDHSSPGDELPAVEPPEETDDVLVIVEHGDAHVAAVATARASGARVVTVAGADPRADPAAIAALAAEPLPDRVVGLGAGFGPADLLRRRLEVAASGVELPGGGQVLFPHRRMVALYGHPAAPVLGVLGEQGADAAVARAHETAAGYQGMVAEPIVPAFEIITTVASAAPGPDGDYSAESEVADLRPWVDAAGRAGVYVVLDLQPGRTDFLTQAQRYEELLAEPHVGLALDPEWRLGPDQRHMAQIGSVGVEEVNTVAAWLATFTRDRRLPQKLLLLHQFQLRMIADRGRLDTSHDELAVLVHADGFGTPGQKVDTWNALHSEPLGGVWWGWKNFIDEDQPTLTPSQTVAVASPWFVSYQ